MPNCHRCKKPAHYRNQCRLLERQKEQSEDTQDNPGNKNNGAKNSIPNNNTNKKKKNNNNYKNNNRAERKPKTAYPPCETCEKTNHYTEKCYYGTNAANRPPPRRRRPGRQNQVQARANQNDSNETAQAAAQKLNWRCHVFTPELWLTDRRLLSFHQFLSCLAATPGDSFNWYTYKLN